MDQRKLYIPFTLVSLVIIMFAFHSILSQNSDAPPLTNPLEFENIIHHRMDNPLTPQHFNQLKAFFPVMDDPEHSFALLFVSGSRSEEHTSELQSRGHLVCRLLLE